MKVKILSFVIIIISCYSAIAQNRYDVVITELMPDPTPVVALPAVEYIELRNTTNANINVLGWRVTDATSTSGTMPSYILKPDSVLIVCSSGSVAALSIYGPTVSVTSFPSLDNDGDIISIRSATGRTIHAVAYTSDWYQNAVKKDGGWSLEMIDTKNPCGGIDNWKASIDTRGGTPGSKNSVDAINADTKAPQLLRTYTNTTTQIVAVYNEPIDSTSGAVVSNYAMSNGISIISAIPQAPTFTTAILNLSTPLLPNTVYTLTVNAVTDCKGNAIGNFNKALNGLPVEADSLELVVNEILFNPKPNGFDYVELYNKSKKILDASKLYIANTNTIGAIANVKKLSEVPYLIFPETYPTLTENSLSIKQNYLVATPDVLIEAPSLPSFNDDASTVILLNFQGKVIDRVAYKDDWHFRLIDNKEGISLERIDPNLPSQNATTWHSASFSSGYGTPTARNSQYKNAAAVLGATVSISPATISPDNDGIEDVLTINYNVKERGYLATVTIYNASGVPVRLLKQNDLLGFTGTWLWDGLNDKGQKLPLGIYIVGTTIYNTIGNKMSTKHTVVLARRLR